MQGQLMTFYYYIYRMWMFVFSYLASVEHEIMKTLRHLIINIFYQLILKTVYLYYQKIR